MSRFNFVLPPVLVHEGGKADNPNDPGGRTNQGVTQRTFTAWLASKGRPSRDVFGMTTAERDTIYRELYWNVIQGDRLGAGLDYTIMDGAVNSGPKQAVKWLQRALGRYYTGSIDGVIGNLTISAVQSYPNPEALINAVMDRRLAFLQALKTWKHFSKGWTRRVSEVRTDALKMAKGVVIEGKAVQTSDANQKARIEDAKALPTTTGGNTTAATGASNVTVGVAVQQAKEALEPYVGLSDYIQWIVVALVITGGAMTIGGLIWRHFSAKKARKLADDLNLLENPGDNVRVA